MIRIEHRLIEDVHILDIEGRLTIEGGTSRFHEAVQRVMRQGGRKLLLNLSGVTHIDSSGIGELVGARTAMENLGGHLKLLHVPPRVHEVLKITKLTTIFDIFEDEETALQSFSSG